VKGLKVPGRPSRRRTILGVKTFVYLLVRRCSVNDAILNSIPANQLKMTQRLKYGHSLMPMNATVRTRCESCTKQPRTNSLVRRIYLFLHRQKMLVFKSTGSVSCTELYKDVAESRISAGPRLRLFPPILHATVSWKPTVRCSMLCSSTRLNNLRDTLKAGAVRLSPLSGPLN
jgi:hypothetical protein